MSGRKPGFVAAALAAVIGLTVSPYARGGIYCVDADDGDDSAGGLSAKTAWKTIAKVNSATFAPGDKVLLKRGCLWRETLEVPSSGAEGRPITFGAYGKGPRPTICGADVIRGWRKESFGGNLWSVVLREVAPPQREFDGNVFEGRGTRSVWFDGARGARAKSRAALSAETNWYFDGYRLYVYSDGDPAETYTRPGIELPVRLEGIRIDKRPYKQRDHQHITIQDLHLCKIRSTGIEAVNCHHVTVRNCHIEWVGPGDKWKDYYHDAVAVGFNHNASFGLVDGCELHDCMCGVYIGTAEPGYAAKGNTVANTRIYNVHSGINAKVHATGGLFEGNVITDVKTQGIRSVGDEKAGNRIVRNYVARCRMEGIQLHSNNTVAYNIVVSCEQAPIVVIGSSGTTEDNINAGDDNRIFNNVLCESPKHAGIAFLNHREGTDTTANIVRNNIFVGIFLPIRFSGGIPAGGGRNVFDNNCYWNPGSAYAKKPGRLSMEKWADEFGWGKHSIIADPKLVSDKPAKPEDFRLKADSPCIDAGADVGESKDFDGNTVPRGKAPDIGAFEHQGK